MKLIRVLLCSLATAAGLSGLTAFAATEATVYKSPTCGCCKKWMSHLADHGFAVTGKDVPDVIPYKIDAKVGPKLASCHTAFIDGYVIEGHVPAADIQRLLKERTDARGLVVPGMPIGSPGMEQGNQKQPYEVLLLHHDGSTSVFASH